MTVQPQPHLKRGRKLKRMVASCSIGFGLALWLLPALPFIPHFHGSITRHRVEKRLRADGTWPTNSVKTNWFDAAARRRGERAASLLTNSPLPWRLPAAFEVIAPGVAVPLTELSNVTASTVMEQRSDGWIFFAQLLETNREHFAAIRRDIGRGPHDFGFDLSPTAWELMEWNQRRDGEGWDQLLEGIMGHWHSLGADAFLGIRENGSRRALGALEDWMSVNDILRDQPVTFAQARRNRGARRALGLTWLLLHEVKLSDDQLSALSKLWSGEDYIHPTVAAFESDLISFHQALASFAAKTHPDPARFLVGRIDSTTTNALEIQLEELGRNGAASAWRFLYADETLAAFAERSAALKRASREILKRHSATEWVAVRQTLRQSWKSQGAYGFARRLPATLFLMSFLDSDADDLSRAAELETEVALARVAIALERFRSAHGAYPDSAQQLVPAYLPEIPRDWQTGKVIRYLRSDAAFKLYALGWDGIDDGGSVEPRPGTSKYQTVWSGKDVVWLRRATAEEIDQWTRKKSEQRDWSPGYRRASARVSTNTALLSTNFATK